MHHILHCTDHYHNIQLILDDVSKPHCPSHPPRLPDSLYVLFMLNLQGFEDIEQRVQDQISSMCQSLVQPCFTTHTCTLKHVGADVKQDVAAGFMMLFALHILSTRINLACFTPLLTTSLFAVLCCLPTQRTDHTLLQSRSQVQPGFHCQTYSSCAMDTRSKACA